MNKLLILFSFINLGLQAQYYEVLNKLHEKGKFNGTAMVIKNGEIVYQGAFGPADKDSTKELDINSAFRLCSVSKQFNCFSITLMEQYGKLNWEDDIRKHIPELPFYGDTIKLKHCAQSTYGLRDLGTYTPLGQ